MAGHHTCGGLDSRLSHCQLLSQLCPSPLLGLDLLVFCLCLLAQLDVLVVDVLLVLWDIILLDGWTIINLHILGWRGILGVKVLATCIRGGV